MPPPDLLAEVALVPDYDGLYAEAATDPATFWSGVADELEWDTQPEHILDWDGVTARWFTGGRCNITINCLDRHLHGAKRDKAALISNCDRPSS